MCIRDSNIFYEIERGSDLEIKCEFNGKAVNVIKKDRRVYITSDLYTTPGVYDVTFTGSNLVSSEITRKGSVIIDKRIQNVTINASKLSLEVNETVTFDFGSLVGSAVVYDVDFDDGVTETKIAKRTQLEHKFSLQGVYTITITAYNSISKEQNSIRVTVLKPVLPLVGLTLEVPQRVNISSSYSMKLLLDQGSDFDCIFTTDDSEIGYRNVDIDRCLCLDLMKSILANRFDGQFANFRESLFLYHDNILEVFYFPIRLGGIIFCFLVRYFVNGSVPTVDSAIEIRTLIQQQFH